MCSLKKDISVVRGLTAGLHDPRVAYWEPAKFVAKLRDFKTDDNMQLFKCDFGAGALMRRTAMQADTFSLFESALLLQIEHGESQCNKQHSGLQARRACWHLTPLYCAALLQQVVACRVSSSNSFSCHGKSQAWRPG